MKTLTNQKGITIIALIITIIIMGILVTVSIQFGTDAIDKSKQEDIKSNMLLIQGRAKIIKDKHTYDEENSSLVGTPISQISGYTISSELQSQINSEKAYILTQEDLNNNGLGNIKTSNTEFYIVDYDTCEVYYSLGINGRYSLTDIQAEE